jgi:hypothetical protein
MQDHGLMDEAPFGVSQGMTGLRPVFLGAQSNSCSSTKTSNLCYSRNYDICISHIDTDGD